MVRKISGREILSDLRSGMSDEELAGKYGLSSSELKKVFKQVDRERAARAKAIAEDLKDGLSEADVREKYNLTGGSFQKIVETLLAAGLLTGTDLLARSAISQEVVVLDLRKGPRYQPSSSISVCEGGATQNRFALQDISEHGFAAKGLESRTGEILNIVVLGDEFGEVVPFEFQAECRWSKRGSLSGNDVVSGFEIRAISAENQVLLRKFIAEYTGKLANNNNG